MKVVIVGNGVAGVTTARYVAERAPSTDIVIYSQEPYPYYPRPKLIDLVAGRAEPESISAYPDAWYEQRRISTHLRCKVVALQPAARQIVLDDGSSVAYDLLVLATGARSWMPPITGADLPHVYTLRTMGDALALYDRARATDRAVILGGGLLGLDTAFALRAHGIAVSVVELLPRLLPRQLDGEGAAVLQGILAAHGMEVIVGDSCTEIRGRGRVEQVALASGRVLEAGMAVVSAGVRPDIDLAREAGLDCGLGVRVDDRLRSSEESIFAVGDAAEFGGRVWGIIPAALAQARVAAAQIAGEDVRYQDIVPSTTLKVAGVDVTSVGEVNPEGPGYTEVRHSDVHAGVYKKLVMRDGYIVGAILIGERAGSSLVNQLMARRVNVWAHVDTLLSGAFDLRSLL